MSKPNNSKKSKTIARFDPVENRWTKLGELKVGRNEHSVIQVNNEFIVVGGDRAASTEREPAESCKLDGQSMTCNTREPELSYFNSYPLLMLIP